MIDQVDAYPLDWPIGWPRATTHHRAPFHAKEQNPSMSWKTSRRRTVGEGRDHLLHELKLLGARKVVISTNVPNSRRDGQIPSDAPNPKDCGAAVYFVLLGKPRVLACDKWDRLADNLTALAKDIEAQRGRIRWGVGSLEQAYAGYSNLLSAVERRSWWQVLGFKERPSLTMAEHVWEGLIAMHHPDKGGDANVAAEINAAIQEARLEATP